MFEMSLYGRAIATRPVKFATGEHYALLWNIPTAVFVPDEREQK